MKTCTKCKQNKPLTDFYKNSNNEDGHRFDCKACHSNSAKKYRQTEKGRNVRRENVRRYRLTKEGRASRKHYIQSEKGKATLKRYYICHTESIKAVRAVFLAILSGKLFRPNTLLCCYCPKPAQQYHHWHGYAKEHWLDVIAVCIDCHRKIHSLIE